MARFQKRPSANRRLVVACGVIPAIITAALALTRPEVLANLDRGVYDTVLRWGRTNPPAGRVVIVDVDERSLSGIGQWPWRRDIVGRLITRLRDLGASTIALDIMFVEPDRHNGTDASTSPDALLAEIVREGHVILGYALTFDASPRGAGACVLHPLGLAVIQPREVTANGPLFRATGVICSLPVLARAAGASGFLNVAPDGDGILRRVPLVLEFEGRVYPGLALAAVTAATKPRDVALRVATVNAASLVLDHQAVPLDGRSNLLLRYRGPKGTFPYVSATDVLSGHVPANIFGDKIVFVGTTALGMRDVVATPLDTLFSGVEVQATVADNLLQHDFIRRPEDGVVLEALISLALGIVVALLVGTTGLTWGAIGAVIGLGALWGGAVWLVSASGVFVSPLFPTVGLLSPLAVMTPAKVALERRRADRAGEKTVTSQRLMVQTLLSLTEVRDAETGRHSRRTQQYVRLLAERLSTRPRFRDYLTPERIELLSSLAPLHDIGKVGVPDRLLNKPSALTSEELAEMQKHPGYGRDVILKAEEQAGVHDDALLEMTKEIVYTHHERWDGNGYPQGLRSADIPISGRLMAVVDVYDALISGRLYHQPVSHREAVDVVAAGKGSHFDPDVVDAFLEVADAMERLRSADVLR